MKRRKAPVYSTAEAFESIRNDYNAAKTSRYRRRRTGVAPTGSGADYHYRSDADYLRMLEQARDMDRNDCIVGQTVDRAVTNALQDGLQLDPQTGDKELDQELWSRWKAWGEDPEQCDIQGEHCWSEQEQLVYRATLVDGDILALPIRDDGYLELVESHRLRTPSNTSKNVVNGILLDGRRKRLEYWLTKDDLSPSKALSKVSDIETYQARDRSGQKQVFHVFNPKRITQTRGVSAFAPIFDVLGMFEDVNFAKLVQQQIVSCFAVFRERSLEGEYGDPPQRGDRESESMSDGGTRTIEGIAPGMEITGQPGEKLTGFSPNVPNNEFFQHVRLILTLVGVNLGLPLVMVMLDASETNFSGWRGAVDQARMGFRRNQKWLAARFHTPVYKWKVRDWLASDAAMRNVAKKSKVDVFGHIWKMPTWPYVDPYKDAQADLLRVRNVLISPRRLHAERGRDWETIAEETVADNAYAIRKAKGEAAKLNTEFKDGNPVHWRELLSLPTPDGVDVALTPSGDSGESDKPSRRQPQEAAA